MELTYYGRTCVRIRGREATIVHDPYTSIVGPTGRGISGDIVTFSHPDDAEFSAAATIAHLTAAGARVDYVVTTDGGRGTEDPGVPSAQLTAVREADFDLHAGETLGVIGDSGSDSRVGGLS